MAHDVFISHHTSSSLSITQEVCSSLEEKGIRCWYAPRDTEGDYATSIYNAIQEARVFILILNKEASYSEDVLNEINLATQRVRDGAELAILPFHISSDDINGAAKYYLARIHWIDAVKPPMQDRIKELTDKVVSLLADRTKYDGENKPKVKNVPVTGEVPCRKDDPAKRNKMIIAGVLAALFLIGIFVDLGYLGDKENTAAEDGKITDSLVSEIVDVNLSAGYNEEKGFGKNDYDLPVHWYIEIEIGCTLDEVNHVSCSWDESAEYARGIYSSELWEYAKKGNTYWEKYSATTSHDKRKYNAVQVVLPDDPAIAGEQYIIVNENQIEFTLDYIGDYSSGTGWKISDIKIPET